MYSPAQALMQSVTTLLHQPVSFPDQQHHQQEKQQHIEAMGVQPVVFQRLHIKDITERINGQQRNKQIAVAVGKYELV